MHKSLSRFFFEAKGAKKRSKGYATLRRIRKRTHKKKRRKKNISPSAEGEEGYAPSTAPPFEKGGRKLSSN